MFIIYSCIDCRFVWIVRIRMHDLFSN
jgi:hypothetical protein